MENLINDERRACNPFKEWQHRSYDKAVKVIKYIFKSLLYRYQIGLETSMKDGFIFGYCNALNILQQSHEIMKKLQKSCK